MVCLLQARWIPSENNQIKKAPDITIISSNELSLIFDADIFGFETAIINTQDMLNTNNETFVLFTIPDCFHTGEIGKPKLPAIKKTIGVPFNAEIKIEVLHTTYKDINLKSVGVDTRIMPALEPVVKLPGQKPVFVIDNETYALDAFYPEEIIKIENDFNTWHQIILHFSLRQQNFFD